MRRAPVPIQPPPTIHVELAERLRVTAARLQAMPPDAATSLSITTSDQGHTEADVRALAGAIAEPLGFTATVDGDGETVTVRFKRSDRRHR